MNSTVARENAKEHTAQLWEILDINQSLTLESINSAIHTMEEVASTLTLLNKSLPKPNIILEAAQEKEFEANGNKMILNRLRIAAVSLLNTNYSKILKAQAEFKKVKLKSNISNRMQIANSGRVCKINHKWNDIKQSNSGINKLRVRNNEKWKKVFQQERHYGSLLPPNEINKTVTVTEDIAENGTDTTAVISTTNSNTPQKIVPSASTGKAHGAHEENIDCPQFTCYVCHTDYSELHSFYPKMCQPCGELNYSKRNQSAQLQGKVALVTGGRIKIGYETVLKLLRCGAMVITTTRFPADAAKRYSHEDDFHTWKDRLHIYALDLRFIAQVESFCTYIHAKYSRLHILIQNAAQTIRRPTVFYRHLLERESCPDESTSFLIHSWEDSLTCNSIDHKILKQVEPDIQMDLDTNISANSEVVCHQNHLAKVSNSVRASQLCVHPEDDLYEKSGTLAEKHFPANCYDEDHQQVDLRPNNSWMLETDQVNTSELLEVHLVNSIAPYIILSKLTPAMRKPAPAVNDDDNDKTEKKYGCVILVSSMEGKFSRWKTSQHPHTNCAKASLNMLARTSAPYYKQLGILLNAVDTGWVTDEEPEEAKLKRYNNAGTEFQPPLDCIDGASRVLDPVFQHFNNIGYREHGRFFKDYTSSSW